jgi:hypothetical protein
MISRVAADSQDRV